MAKDQIIYHVEKCYLYHLFVYKPVQPFYKGNQSKDFRVIMDPVKKFEGHYEGGGSGCQDVPVSLNARYFRYPLGAADSDRAWHWFRARVSRLRDACELRRYPPVVWLGDICKSYLQHRPND